MKHAKTWIAALLCSYLLIVGVTTWAIAGFERTLSGGQTVLVELAPADPRSMMQGDYMALNFAVDNALWHQYGTFSTFARNARPHPPLYAYLTIDAQGRTNLAGTGNTLPAPQGQVAMRLRMQNKHLSVGTNAFFFQERTGRAYAQARWGEFRVAPDGKALLVALRDKALVRIQPVLPENKSEQ